jgi:hypothetical protein
MGTWHQRKSDKTFKLNLLIFGAVGLSCTSSLIGISIQFSKAKDSDTQNL